MEILLSSSTKIIIALCSYLTIFTLILFLSWYSKQTIKSTCAYSLLGFLGTILVLVFGFSGLALQIVTENQSECGQYNKKYIVGMKYAYCQVHHVTTDYFNKTIPDLETLLHNWIKRMETAKPMECHNIKILLNLNSCVKRGAPIPETVDALNLNEFQKLGKLPYCEREDPFKLCIAKKLRLVTQMEQALTTQES